MVELDMPEGCVYVFAVILFVIVAGRMERILWMAYKMSFYETRK